MWVSDIEKTESSSMILKRSKPNESKRGNIKSIGWISKNISLKIEIQRETDEFSRNTWYERRVNGIIINTIRKIHNFPRILPSIIVSIGVVESANENVLPRTPFFCSKMQFAKNGNNGTNMS